MQESQPKMESDYKMPPSLENALRELSKEVGELTGEVRANTTNVAKILDRLEKRDDEIEQKADEANEEIKSAKNKFIGIGIGSALGGGGIAHFLAKVFG